MGQAEFKEKLGDRGHIKGEKTFNTKSGTRESKFHTEWQGKSKAPSNKKKGD